MDAELFPTSDIQPLPPHAGYARVALDTGVEGEDGTLTYAFDGTPPDVGQRVEVPLGRGSRRVAGMIVEVGGDALRGSLAASRIRRITRQFDARLPADLLDLARWISTYYACPLGIVFASMLPAAVSAAPSTRPVTMVDLEHTPTPAGLRASSRAVLERLHALGPTRFPMVLAQAIEASAVASRRPLDTLARAGLLRMWEEVRADPTPPAPTHTPRDRPALTPEQRDAVEGIAGTPGFGVHLLRGVTGSGKTEVYLHLIEHALAQGTSAIVLVPEIALTPQTVARFTDRFGPRVVAALHSGLTPAQRTRAWHRAAAGEARVVVGARSAVFAPVPALGIIVVDEEHDASYKQDRAPRYHARDTAIVRAKAAGVPIVLGSATPSMESWRHARDGKYRLWTLPARVGGGTLPEVRVVDLRAERRADRDAGLDDGRVRLLGPTLRSALEHTLRSGGQAILLLNRRGLARYVWCRDSVCGFVLCCDHCDAALVVHRTGDKPEGGIVRCHHCDAAQRVPTLCPACGSRLALFAWGTQRAEDEVAGTFGSLGLEPGRTLLRLDADAVRSAADFARALGAFERGEARVLLGTQMIAKGLDFPNVRLVGVLDADTSLVIPDFRAAERTFQLVSQVAGRAGRGTHPGLVIVQTLRPDDPAIEFAARHDFEGFAELELAIRARSELPPYARMARVICRSEDLAEARTLARDLTAHLAADPALRVRGPMPCVIARIAGVHRIVVEVLAPTASDIQRAFASARACGFLRSDSRTQVDVDPAALL